MADAAERKRNQDFKALGIASTGVFYRKILPRGLRERYFDNKQHYDFDQKTHPYSFEYPLLAPPDRKNGNNGNNGNNGDNGNNNNGNGFMPLVEAQSMRRAILQNLEGKEITHSVDAGAVYQEDKTNLIALPDDNVHTERDYIPLEFYPFLTSDAAKRVPFRYRMWDPAEPSVPRMQEPNKLLQDYAPTFEMSGGSLVSSWLRKITQDPAEYVKIQPIDLQKVGLTPWIWTDLLYKADQFRPLDVNRSVFGEQVDADPRVTNRRHRQARFRLWERYMSALKPPMPVLLEAMNATR